jgi:hypothetical protein
MQFIFSPDLNIRICPKKILHDHLALFIQLCILEIILRITLFFLSLSITSHTQFMIYQYRTINKFSHIKCSYCLKLVIHVDINLLQSFPCGCLYFINCFNWYNSMVTVSFIKFWVSMALHIQILFFWILISSSILKTESPCLYEMFVSMFIIAHYHNPELLLFCKLTLLFLQFLESAYIFIPLCYHHLIGSAGKKSKIYAGICIYF